MKMNKNYFVLDNVLTKEHENEIEDLLTGVNFPYFFDGLYTSEGIEKFSNIKNLVDHRQMVHAIYLIDDNGDTYCNSNEFSYITDTIVSKLLTHFKKEKIVLKRAKINLQHQFTDNKPEYHNVPHYDLQDRNHFVCIYYVNDSDGDTLFFDNEKNCNVIGRVSPKKGRLLFFNGNMLHASQHPLKSSERVVINMDFEGDFND